MKSLEKNNYRMLFLGVVLGLILFSCEAFAVIPGVMGDTFNFTVRSGHIQTPDGGSYLMWGYSDDDGRNMMQYPGPTIIVEEGTAVTINLKNALQSNPPVNVSMVFPGQYNATAKGGIVGLITNEAPQNDATVVTYTFEANEPGTYLYHSGTNPELQVEMGMIGAIIVRPTGYDPNTNRIAYSDAATTYDYEYLFLLTEMDPRIHLLMETGCMNQVNNADYFPVNWFINGRCAPDTMRMPFFELLPNQPYNCLPRMNPGGRMLMRMIGGGRDLHPFHTHGNNFVQIARDGRLLEEVRDAGNGPDLGVSNFTQNVVPGGTYDAIFEWTGAGLGWDIYGHDANNPDPAPHEYMEDHLKPFPVTLPAQKDLAFGAFYSGSPFLGVFDPLPPGQGGLSINGGLFYMWHSHNEKEMVNNDIFPGGLMTMLIIEPPGIIIP